MDQQPWKTRFFTIWAGQAVSLLTSSLVQYVFIWYLTFKTGSAAVLSLASMIGFLPMVLLSPFVGSFVDRYSRKCIMIVSDGITAFAALSVAIYGMFQEIPVYLIFVVLFIRSIAGAFQQPCINAVTPSIVPEDMLAKCGGYTQSFLSISMIISPALAAVLYAAFPFHIIMLVDVVGALAATACLVFFHIPKGQATQRTNILQETKDGLKVLYGHKGIWYLVLISSLFCLAYIPAGSLYPLMCIDYFGGNEYHSGLVEMLFSIGMLLGGLLLGVWGGTKNKMTVMLASLAVIGAALWAIGVLPPTAFILFAVLSFITGFVAPFFNSLFMVILQEKTAPEFLGRVLGVSNSIMCLAGPVGLSFSALFAERIGINNWFIVSGVISFICVALCVIIQPVRDIDKAVEE